MLLSHRLPLKYFLNTIQKEMFYITVVTFILFLVHLKFSFFEMPVLVSAILGTTIALILSFRLSQSYDRWWEARQIWGSITNDSRTLTLQVLHFTKEEDTEIAIKMAKMQIVWVNSLSHNLREQKVDESYVKKYLPSEVQKSILKSNQSALDVSSLLYKELEKLTTIDTYKRMQINNTLVRLVDAMGKAERIKKTVFPIEYPFYLHMSIYLFLAFMSVSLANLGHHWEILLIVFISAPFFMLEKAAEHLQDPFENRPSDIPLSAMARGIEINILTLLGEDEIPPVYEANDYYLN